MNEEGEVKRKNLPRRKPLAWLHGEIKSPPFTEVGRREAGELLRLLQEGESLGIPHAEPLRSSGAIVARFASGTVNTIGESCIESIRTRFWCSRYMRKKRVGFLKR